MLRRGADPLLAPQHVADVHQMVVHDHGQVVGGEAVGLDQHLHVDLPPRDFDVAAQPICEPADALFGHRQAHHMGFAGRHALAYFGRRKRLAAAIVARRLARRLLLSTHGLEAFGRAEAAERPAALEQLLGMATVDVEPFALPIRAVVAPDIRPFVPLDAGPAQRLEDGRLGSRRAAGAIGIFDAQDEPPSPAVGEDLVEQRHVGSANMGIAGGAWCDSGADWHSISSSAQTTFTKNMTISGATTGRRLGKFLTDLVRTTRQQRTWRCRHGRSPVGPRLSAARHGSGCVLRRRRAEPRVRSRGLRRAGGERRPHVERRARWLSSRTSARWR